MITRETIEKWLEQKLDIRNYGNGSDFSRLFNDFVFAGGVGISNVQLIECLKYLFSLATKVVKDDLALAILEKLHKTYHAAEEDIEYKKERQHMGMARERADDKFFVFITSIYFEIPNYKKREFDGHDNPVMQKTRFKALEYAAEQWTNLETTGKSYEAFRFLIKAFETQEKKEILDKIFRPRVENWFKNVEFIEKWIMVSREHPVPHEIQHLLAMARAKNGGPELAKRDIANSMALVAKTPLGPEDLEDPRA